MKIVNKEELRELIERRETPCVSIYMPAHRKGKETEQNVIRFKNLLRKAEEELKEWGVKSLEVQRQLKPAYALVENLPFWQHQSDGLAVFVNGGIRHYRLPVMFPELVVVNDRFHVKPLLPLFNGDGQFYVLGLNLDGVALLRGTRYTVAEVDLKKAPKSLADALKYDLLQKEPQFHPSSAPRAGRREAVYYGTGGTDQDRKNEILRYFQQVDGGIRDLLREEHSPLLLAGLEYLTAIYRQASKYPHIFDKILEGDTKEMVPEELHRRAWMLIEPHFLNAQTKAFGRFEQLRGVGSPQAITDIPSIVDAAVSGRVESLFTTAGVVKWGSVDPQSGEIEFHDPAKPGDQDLLDFAAVHTIFKGGVVYALTTAEVPGGGAAAAVLRY